MKVYSILKYFLCRQQEGLYYSLQKAFREKKWKSNLSLELTSKLFSFAFKLDSDKL